LKDKYISMSRTLPISAPASFEACTETMIAQSLALDNDLQAQFAHDIFQNLLGLELDPEQSFLAWQQISEWRSQWAKDKGEIVSFHQAILEYFVHSPLLKDPIVTEFDELQRLRLTSTTDHLTGTHNRRLFDAFLGKEVQRAARYGNDLSLVIIDLNRFKQINDKHGHATGDELLILTGRLMVDSLRNSDYTYRIGGDEFALLLPQAAHPDAVALAERLRCRFEDAVRPRDLGIPVSLAYGVATSPREAKDPRVLFELADQRLYDYKRSIGSPRCVPRIHERLALNGVNAYAILRVNSHSLRGRLIDFGIGGVGLRVPMDVQVPESFDADLHLQILPPVPVSLRKVYLGPEEPEGRRVGCAFTAPLPDYAKLRP
jgi:diguanylate cyclase (GGDEF)-like protein